MVIDDEADIREVLAISLADAGYDVKTAADGEAGLRLCEECSPRIVITDIRMPRMDGIQVLEAVKNRSPDTEVIVATAFGEMELAIRALQLDASDFVTKPINDEALHLALKRARDRYTSRKQLKDYTGFLERERVETARELMRTFAFQKNLIENSMDGIIACDASGAIVTFNRAIEKMLGRGREEVIGVMGLHRFFLPGEAKQLITSLSGEGHGGENRLFLYETRLVGKDGKQVPVQASGAVLFHGGVEEGRVFFFRDLREIRALEREVQDQARVLHQDKMMSLGRLAASVV
ncbi:MAG: response regulator, partial [Desulfobacterales bacterium]|nr:response regulator [Desulfobacterales bacterium]